MLFTERSFHYHMELQLYLSVNIVVFIVCSAFCVSGGRYPQDGCTESTGIYIDYLMINLYLYIQYSNVNVF